MKNKKKLAAALLSSALCLSMTAVYADVYSDLMDEAKNQNIANKMQTLMDKKIMLGTENGMEPDREVSRAEALTLALRCFGADVPHADSSPFSDIPLTHWACDAAAYAKSQGWIDGTGDNMFTPDRTVSGRELCKILLTVRGDTGVTIENAADMALTSGLIDMSSEKQITEKAALTRGDTAVLCCNALDISAVPQEERTTFAWKLNDMMTDEENYCISPYSLQTALAMAANGAQGDSQKELLNLLGIDDLDAFNRQNKSTAVRYKDAEITVDTANSIWLNETNAFGNKFSEKFKNTIADYYDGEARVSDRDHVVNDVNAWVNEKTREKIPALLSDNDNQSAAYLVNAVYFLGDWECPFEAEATRDDTFHTRDSREITIPFMHDKRYVSYYGDSHIQMIALPYKSSSNDNRFSMYIAISDGEKTPESYIPQMSKQLVNIKLPKFKTEYTQDFTQTLQAMGLKSCMGFSDDFGPMFDPASVEFGIEKVLQKAYLAVDEKGTEAAAATAVMMVGSSALVTDTPIAIPFTADKPFTYFIYDETAQEILFMGEYAF